VTHRDAPDALRHAIRWTFGRAVDPAALEPVLAQLLGAVASGASPDRKRGRRKGLHRWRAPDGEEYLLKTNRYAGLDAWVRGVRGGKARRELAIAEALAERGLPAPVPLAAGEQRRAGRLLADYLLVAPLAGAEELGRVWRGSGRAPALRRSLAAGFGALVRDLEEAGLEHRDLAPNNVLVRRGDPPTLLPIDFERARLGPPARSAGRRRDPSRTSGSPRARIRALARLARRVGREASAAQRLRFLRSHARGDPARARHWWRAVVRELPRQARRDLRHWLRTATVPGRRFSRIEGVAGGGWEGFLRRDPAGDEPLPVLLAAAARAAERRAPGARARAGADPEAPLWCVAYPALSRRSRVRLWAQAQVLWDGWRLVPRPIALLRRNEATVLLLERPPGARSLAGEAERSTGPPAGATSPAVRVLVDHLEALGRLRRPLGPTALALHPGREGPEGGRAMLLDPRLWEPALGGLWLGSPRRARVRGDRPRGPRGRGAKLSSGPEPGCDAPRRR